jgi:thymidylate synthase
MSGSSLTTFNPPYFFRGTYETLLMRLLKTDYSELNERTGERIRSLDPVSFTLNLRNGHVPTCGIRKTFMKTAAAEVAWFLSGSSDVTWLKQHAPVWNDFVEDDGFTIRGAYGYRWRGHFGRDQIALAVQALEANPTDRRVWVSAWDPAADGLGAQGQKNVPCPVGFSLSIRDGRLNSSLVMRSSDVFVGLPYDVMGHALLMDAVACSLGVQLGVMHVTLAHPHLYEVHMQMAWEALGSTPCDDAPKLPHWSLGLIERDKDGYVALARELQTEAVQPVYHCRPEVVK